MQALPSAPSQPISAFYGGNRLARGLGHLLQVTQRLAPGWGTRAALRLFFTPLPTKRRARRRAVPAGWSTVRWPFEGGVLTAYRREETRPGRPVVLLVHGWAGHAWQMGPLAAALEAAGAEPVLLDLPGHGRSDGWSSTLPQFTRALWAASARLGPVDAAVAHSMGALAVAHATAHGWPVGRLALLATAPPPTQVLQWFTQGFGLGGAMAMRMRRLIERREGLDLDRFQTDELGPRLPAATLVVHDQDDTSAPWAAAHDFATAIPGSDWHLTQGLGHRRLLADPGVTRRVAEHVTGSGGG